MGSELSRRYRSSWRVEAAEAVYEVVRELGEAGVYRFAVGRLFYQLASGGVLKAVGQGCENLGALPVGLGGRPAAGLDVYRHV